MSSERTLVVAAWEPELERLRSRAGEGGVQPLRLSLASIGIGLVDASLGTARVLEVHRPNRVILLGTCGAAPSSSLTIGDVIVGTSVRLVDPATVEGRAAMPFGSEALALDSTVIDASPSGGPRLATIANTLGITTDDGLAATLAASGEVEHLEAYGVARACALAGVSCTVILGVTNIVGARGRDDWRANHVAMSARAADVAWDAVLSIGRASWSPKGG